MVDERDDRYELPDDGEYHFSDDQVNYDIDPEVVKAPEPDAASGTAAVSGINQFRRPLIGIVVFVVLIFLVYKLLAPAATSPTSDFTPVATPAASTTSTTKTVTTTNKLSTAAVANSQQTLPAASTTQTIKTSAVPSEPTPNMTATLPETTKTVTTNTSPAAIAEPKTTTTVTIPNPAANQSQENILNSGLSGEIASTSSMEKLVLLQQQNTKLIAQLQTETSQRISGYQAQAAEMDNRIQELSMHVSKIENTLAQLSKVIQDLKVAGPATVAPSATTTVTNTVQPIRMSPPPERSLPRVHYTVQAIIPGRAWLKSDSGETITVAEGDMLKNAGRIMKIDPYDGVVEIDMNGRIISLSYGSNTD